MKKKENKEKKSNKAFGPLLAIMVFLFIVACGYTLGKFLAKKYNNEHNTNYNVLKVIRILSENNDTDKTQTTNILSNEIKSISDLCGADTGICNKVVGTVTLKDQKYNLFIYNDFDNIAEETSYLKIGDTKVGNFISLNNFTTIFNKYLVATESKEDNNFVIHIYDKTGTEKKNINGYYNNGELFLVENKLYYYYCDASDLDESGNKALKYNTLSENNNEIKIEEISKEYGKC